jgi:DNA-binding transcriptional LysR family regulator
MYSQTASVGSGVLELKQLEHFVVVAREGGVARAARRLSLSQPSLTRSIGALEKTLKVILFDRSSRGTKLNEAGNKLLPHAIAMLQEAERARAEFGAPGHRIGAEVVRVGISPNMLCTWLPRLLRGVVEESSNSRYVVSTNTHEELYKCLRQRDLDLVICMTTGIFVEPKVDHVKYHLVGSEQMLPVAPPGHSILKAKSLSLEDAARYNWAVPLQMSVTYRFEYAFHQRGLPIAVQKLNSSSLTLMLEAVSEWGMLGMLPRSLLDSRAGAADLVRLDIPELVMDYDISILTNASDELSDEALQFVDALRLESKDAAVRNTAEHMEAEQGLIEMVQARS